MGFKISAARFQFLIRTVNLPLIPDLEAKTFMWHRLDARAGESVRFRFALTSEEEEEAKF